ncbi:CRISPR-associated helicase Cas3' [uncultured Megasphaera sp.]|uniref:CRISPR-associated helicase Cas3' n=1 Tax=uncultured Megasphaera sp. TaxID=165188 RepID=UPI0025EA3B72|nr:CRISPR-associated helicase Cas3' [uncultured Megasphaera sp.]
MEIIAHFRKDENGRIVVQPLRNHLVNVAEKMEAAATPWGLGALAKLTGLLHDFSKSQSTSSGECMPFQKYIRLALEDPKKAAHYRGKIDHSTGGAQFLGNRYRHREGYFVGKTINLAGLSVMSHHGGLANFLSERGESDYVRRIQKEGVETAEEEAYFFESVLSPAELDDLFNKALDEVEKLDGFINKASKAGGKDQNSEDRIYWFYWGMVERLLFSWLVDADRLDTAEFMGGSSLTQDWDYDELWNLFSGKLEDRLHSFALPAEGKARAIALERQKISDACQHFGTEKPGIYSLSVPTGSGKTLASMRFALAQAKKYHKKRIIVVIPYTSIIDQNAKEIRDVFQFDEAVLEHHSNVLPKEDMSEEERDWRKLLTERWDTPVIFTTQVQFLNTLFDSSCQSARRLQALADSIIIFDEIQTLPVKCTYIFNLAMNFLKDFAGVTAVLCTATQPQLDRMDVPIHVDSEMIDNLNDTFEAFQRVRFEYLKDELYTAETLAPRLLHDARERGSVLCIVNLTRQARTIYQALQNLVKESQDDVDIIHLSTKMCPAHRKNEIDRMREALAALHGGTSKRRLICISTQLIEAGVDVSFTTVYRAMAGFASIAQAAGRCNRHGEMEYGVVKVFHLEGEKLDKLPDIQTGVKVAADLLHTMEIQDILQPTNMARYFEAYYAAQGERNKSYELPSRNTLLDLLSLNEAGWQACKELGNGADLALLRDTQAFGDAGRAFYVIDSATSGIVVPYGDGAGLITALNGEVEDPKKLLALLKTAQQYTVNAFSYEVEQLQRMGAIFQTLQGPLALNASNYDPAIGLKLEEQANPLCNY